MICQSELQQLHCNKRSVLQTLAVVIAPFAPHLAEEMWHLTTDSEKSVCDAQWPEVEEKYLSENTQKYPVQFNGKVRFTIEVPKDTPREQVEQKVMADPQTTKYLAGATPKKVIVVPGRIVNIVI